MRRRNFIGLLAGAAAGMPLAAYGQQGRLRRIGVLMSLAPTDPDARLRLTAFEQGLREHGWIEGRNLKSEHRGSSRDDELAGEARELVRLAPEVILSNSTPATVALKEQGAGMPVVFVQMTDPVGSGVVASLARPGSNFTGFTSFEFSIGSKWMEMLKVVAPRVTRVALVYNPKTAPFAEMFRGPIEAAAPSFDIAPVVAAAADGAELERVLDQFAREPNGGLIVLPDITTTNYRDSIIALAQRHRLPAMYPFRFFAVSGGLMSYGTDVSDVFQRAAGYVDRILRGGRAGELPVQAPNKFEQVMNLKTAKALGITMPPLLLARSDEVIE
jgi:putative ABC transport system substrate-binding protein